MEFIHFARKEAIASKITEEAATLKIDSLFLQFDQMLENGEYHFKNNTLFYMDLEGGNLVKRRALLTMTNEMLTFKEIGKAFERQAQIN
ncbi:hypothetical protein [Marivirga arenosa]|uniref:Uncharacterized protein n=1 Tax=Marivirga arenosa TaxID=3059076 RepID=A0AA49GDJ9_9BACT|nr:hypothetical protein [Marivirga sp. BKB1-2]WKK79942.1 hypothetical protein QYS47_22200 [Marivirga sp. BKB1-2]